MLLTVNGKQVDVAADADATLLWVLREQLKLTGTKYGCGMALCGACTVHVDGKAVIAFAMECYEHGIITREMTGGIDLTWGNADAVIEMVHRIGRREELVGAVYRCLLDHHPGVEAGHDRPSDLQRPAGPDVGDDREVRLHVR